MKKKITREQIKEGNTIIAKFMGYQILFKEFQYEEFNSSNESYWADGEGDVVCDSTGYVVEDSMGNPLCDLAGIPFDDSRDTLIPVIEKIIELSGKKEISASFRYEYDLIQKLLQFKFISPVKEVWEVAIEYIKWYNAQQK